MKLVLLTSTGLRHKYLAATLAEAFELVLVGAELKSPKIEDTAALPPADAALVTQHFDQRETSEKEFFGNYSDFPQGIPVQELPHGEINSEAFAEKVTELQPDYIILFGSSILKGSLLKDFTGRVINLHLGLSPYYVGSGTNLFPYYYREPECIGATVHLATDSVDAGAILHQLRPDLTSEDNLHQIGNKVIEKAGKQLPAVLRQYASGQLPPQPQSPSQRTCRIKDFTPGILREIHLNFKKNFIETYLREKEQRDAAKPIIQKAL